MKKKENCGSMIANKRRKGKVFMNIVLLLSGGTGIRLGSKIPKQYIQVGNRSIISYSMEQLFRHSEIDAIQITADKEWREVIEKSIKLYDREDKFRGFSEPGKSRQLSILNALEDIEAYADDTDYIFIHDAARPALSRELIAACLRAAVGHDGALPVLPMKDTVYSSTDGVRISSLLNRAEIFSGQAPEIFLFGKYLKANRDLLPDKILQINGSTEPAIMAGMDIALIPGDENNYKITTKADLERFQAEIMRAKKGE